METRSDKLERRSGFSLHNMCTTLMVFAARGDRRLPARSMEKMPSPGDCRYALGDVWRLRFNQLAIATPT